MFALINTMSSTDRSLGYVISRHRSIEAAIEADRKYQARVKRASGQASYIPTVIAHIHTSGGSAALRSSNADRHFFTAIDSDSYFDAQID